jgi:uncharacterized membrane protein
MILKITDPAIMFSGISLLILVYTNRYVALASVIRALNLNLTPDDEANRLLQIKQLNQRIVLSKYMQAFGILSFLFCLCSMISLFFSNQHFGNLFFISSLITIVISVILSLIEILKSGESLKIELERTRARELVKKHDKQEKHS